MGLLNFKKYIKRFSESVIIKNFAALSILQVANYIFPLLTLPYIARMFEPELYGVINFAGSIIVYFTLIINYGFELSASREISQNRDDWEKVEKIFNNIIFAKLFLFAISFIIFIITLLSINKIYDYKYLYIIMFLGNIFNVFYPTWFFQGIEKLSLVAFLTFIFKLVFTILIFVIIKNKDDYLLYPISAIIGQAISSVIAIVIIYKSFKIKIKIPKLKNILEVLKSDFRIFLMTIITNLYTTTNIIFLGFLASAYSVGLYTSANKIVMIVITIITRSLSQTFFPSIGYSFSKSLNVGLKKLYKSFYLVSFLSVLPSLFLFFFSQSVIDILFGQKYSDANITLKIMAFLPLIVGVSSVFGVQGLINIREDKIMVIISLIGAVVSITLNLILIPIYDYNGSAISILITELIVSVLAYLIFRIKIKGKLKFLKKVNYS